MYKLRQYQKDAANFLYFRPRAALFLGCGFGKTLVMLALLSKLEFETCAIVAPPAVCKSTWQNEAKKWGLEHLLDKIEFISNCNTKILKRSYDIVIVDELSAFKNSNTHRFKDLKKVKSKRFYGLTGTPVSNSMVDLWAQMYLLDKNILGLKGTYLAKYFTPIKYDKFTDWKIKKACIPLIYEDIKPFVFRTSGKLDDLPHIYFQKEEVNLSKVDYIKYNKFKQDLLLRLKDEVITAANAAVMANKLLQYASGSMVLEDGGYETIHNKKIEALERLIYQPTCIFYNFKHDKAEIVKCLEKHKKKYTFDDFDGWNQGKYDAIVLHPKSAGYGLNLQQGGNLIIWYSPTWSLEMYTQANARLWRSGQENNVIVKHITVTKTIEERVYQALQCKEDIQNLFLDEFKKGG